MTTTIETNTSTEPKTSSEAMVLPGSARSRPIVRKPPGFGAALRSEWIKLATVRSPRAIAGLTMLVGGFAAFAVARFVTDEVVTISNIFGFSAVFTAVFSAVSGILIHTADAESRTIQQAFAAQQERVSRELTEETTAFDAEFIGNITSIVDSLKAQNGYDFVLISGGIANNILSAGHNSHSIYFHREFQ